MDSIFGRKITERIDFEPEEQTFGAFYKAEQYLRERGYSFGSMQRDAAIGVMKETGWHISKFRNLEKEDIAQMDGWIITYKGSFREGGASIVFHK